MNIPERRELYVRAIKEIEYFLKYKKIVTFFQQLLDNKNEEIRARKMELIAHVLEPLNSIQILFHSCNYPNVNIHTIEDGFHLLDISDRWTTFTIDKLYELINSI
jgi:hypothetical protein